MQLSNQLKKQMRSSFALRKKYFGNEIIFYPSPFTPVSITGSYCELNCKHCGKHYLMPMVFAENEKEIKKKLSHLKKGVVLSGGCLKDGSVPIYKFAKILKEIKKKKNLKFNAHTGIINEQQAKLLGEFLDNALTDIIGSNETIKEIYGINAKVEDYKRTLNLLKENKIEITPHVIVGLHYSELRGEFNAIKMIKEIWKNKKGKKTLIIVIFIPTKNTPMENLKPIEIEKVVEVICFARRIFGKDVSISLSCVRPGGKYRSLLDEFAILSGVNKISVPSKNAYKIAEKLGLKVREINGCCSEDL